jgi:hypothetical protein
LWAAGLGLAGRVIRLVLLRVRDPFEARPDDCEVVGVLPETCPITVVNRPAARPTTLA